jgi:5-methylcytosine-specific restriction endonuclease McrA
MDPFWLILIGGFLLFRISAWSRNARRIDEWRREKALQDSYIAKAKEDYPDQVDVYWKPKRNPVPREFRPKILSRTEGRCFYCDIYLADLFEWQVDHVWPYRYGGSEDLINLVPACKDCNESKWSYLPPRYFLHKWVLGKEFTSHEIRFLEFYKNHSMSNLIGTSAHWKGRADYWSATIFPEFVDLVLDNEGLKHSVGKNRDTLLKRAQNIYNKLDCDVTLRGRSRISLLEWLESEKWMEEFLREKKDNEE